MARRNPASFMKRMKELKRKEKARLKRERRQNKNNPAYEVGGANMKYGPFGPAVTESRPADAVDESPREQETPQPPAE